MRSLPIGFLCIALAACFWAGCGGCGGCGGKPEAAKPADESQARASEPTPAQPPEAAKRELATPSRTKQDPRQHSPRQYRAGVQTASPDKPLSIVKVPQVTRQEIDADSRLSNQKMPLASKRTLKILEKAQKNNPNLTKPDSWYTGGKSDAK